MTTWDVQITSVAEADHMEPMLYIRDVLQSPQAALNLLDQFEECVTELSSQPAMHPLVRDERLTRLGYRWAPVVGHIAFYTLDMPSSTVYVERVLYGRSDWRAML